MVELRKNLTLTASSQDFKMADFVSHVFAIRRVFQGTAAPGHLPAFCFAHS